MKTIPASEKMNPDRELVAKRPPGSKSEAAFQERIAAQSMVSHRVGWPDFLVETPDGVIGVEVKSSRDRLRSSQRRMFASLVATGLKVYVWWEPCPEMLLRWDDFDTMATALDEFGPTDKRQHKVSDWVRTRIRMMGLSVRLL